MGTNYYHRFNLCSECGRYDERHIGKHSFGWEFSFRGYKQWEDYKGFRSWADWQRELAKGGKIFDEYGTEISRADFVAMVEATKGKLSHYDEILNSPKYGASFLQDDWKDAEGWSFSATEFS